MAEVNENPVELFDMYVAHVGINATDPDDAKAISSEFGRLMGFTEYDTPVSLFADTLVEVMKQNGRGTKGHIGFHVNDMPAAEKWFSDRGFELNEDSRALNPDGSTRLVYFKQEIGGFAIHLTSDK
ncbi:MULTISPECIES: VOC family protein [Collinsella]|uniref:2-dehydro-3-deoxyphosphogluconate aldolase n=1 Tax=Collinsella TaxID=102106 RepID=UPI00082DBDF5|nr:MULTISPECIES: 2-dehydro-3-deoxyphosphogluconate aldolase [Collinsella]MBM6776486.1 VOC family protein [Collinsella tanakaei]MDN0054688.1 VOC family protein [Collinsella ihumii]OUO59253.1 2-dehydro-3-deoxyphosphogluconate aldolase [Collinsella sp. An271]